MRVILREKVPGLGNPGEIRDVADGYARNYLLPKKFALVAGPGTEKQVANEQRFRQAREEKRRRERLELAGRLRDVSLTIPMVVSEEERLYGSVNAREIVQALLAQEKIELEERTIHLEEPIRMLGVYRVPVVLAEQVESILTVWVVKENAGHAA